VFSGAVGDIILEGISTENINHNFTLAKAKDINILANSHNGTLFIHEVSSK
jgi:hypothetical protein